MRYFRIKAGSNFSPYYRKTYLYQLQVSYRLKKQFCQIELLQGFSCYQKKTDKISANISDTVLYGLLHNAYSLL